MGILPNDDIERLFQDLANIGQSLFDALLPIVIATNEAVRKVYQDIGSPYGDTDEGYSQWLDELAQRIPNYRK